MSDSNLVAALSYADAFYEIAAMLGISARADTPGNVWRNEMRPALESTLRARQPAQVAPEGEREAVGRAIVADIERGAAVNGSTFCYDAETGCLDFDGVFRPIEVAAAVLAALRAPAPAARGGVTGAMQAALDGLDNAADWFEDYRAQHDAKGTAEAYDKARANERRRDECKHRANALRAALAADKADGSGEGK